MVRERFVRVIDFFQFPIKIIVTQSRVLQRGIGGRGSYVVDRRRLELLIPGVDAGAVAVTTIGPRSPDKQKFLHDCSQNFFRASHRRNIATPGI